MPKKYRYSGNGYYSIDREEYYDRLLFPKGSDFYRKIFKSRDTALKINSPIIFRKLEFGVNPKTTIEKLGIPRYIIENHGIASHILFYKEKINGHRVITQLHFLNEEFFCANYAFRYESNSERIVIKKMLFEKHANMNGTTFERYNAIADPSGNSIFISDDVFLTILYLWGNEKVIQALSPFSPAPSFMEEHKKKSSGTGLFGRL